MLGAELMLNPVNGVILHLVQRLINYIIITSDYCRYGCLESSATTNLLR